MTKLERTYRLALRALPTDFRVKYGDELLRLYRQRVDDESRQGLLRGMRRAASEISDVLLTAHRLRRGRSSALSSTRAARSGVVLTAWALIRELRFAARALRRRPTYALTAAGTLALGIGAVTAIFAVVDAVLLRPLPYHDPDRLVMVWRELRQYGFHRAPSSLPDLVDWASQARGFEQIAGATGAAATLQSEGGPERLQGSRVTGNLFATLGAPLHLGRAVQPSDDRPGAEPVVVLSYGLWQRRFGESPDVLGTTLQLGSTTPRVIGVTEQGFDYPGPQVEFWVPIAQDVASTPRDMNFLQLVGRLRPDFTKEAAQADLLAVARRVQQAHPGESAFDNVWVEPLHAFVVGAVRTTLFLLSGAVLVLFALASVNLANLLLLRAVGRRRELALRAALGSSASGLRAPLLSESLLIAVAGGALGLAFAAGAVRLLLALEPGVLPRRAAVAIDLRVFAFAAGLSLLCALLCGALPVWAAGRRAPGDSLQERAGRRMGPGTRRLQGALVVTQVASAVALLVGAGLLGRSFFGLISVPTGFDPRGVLTAQVPLPPARYGSPADVAAFYDQLFERLRGLPGVDAVGGTWALPFSPAFASSTLLPEGADSARARTISMAPVRGDYFRAVGMQLLRGRGPGPQDGAADPPVAVVNEALAELFWPGEDPIGKRFVPADGDDGPTTVIGVVADIKRQSLDEPLSLDAYLPHSQTIGWGRDLYVALHTDGDPLALVASLREAVWSLDAALPVALDAALPVARVATLGERVSQSVAAPRFRSLVLAMLATSATLLAAVGLYGVLAYLVSQHRRDLAVRFALGARRGRVVAEVVGRALGLTAIGLAIGLSGSAAGARALRTFLFQVEPVDALTFVAAAGLFVLVTLVAAWVPARRAAAADPASVLQSE